MKIILQQRTSLNSKINKKGTGKKCGEVCKPEDIICPCKADNVQNYFAYFWNYTQVEVMKTSNLEILFVLFPVGYLNTILITDINKVLKDPLDPGEVMSWVGFWFDMVCWVGILDRLDWWLVTPPVMHIGHPFYMS